MLTLNSSMATNASAGMVQIPWGWPEDCSWTQVFAPLFGDPKFLALQDFVIRQRQTQTVFPPPEKTFAAFALTPKDRVRVVILGQDPYHGVGQAEGLSFSVAPGVAFPPSLRNIFKELVADTGAEMPAQGSLRGWAAQGVLLLNTVLTVRQGEPQSHAGQGWEWFTDRVIETLVACDRPKLFVLWGAPAQKKRILIRPPHGVLLAPHPSPLSAHRGFFGSRPFSQANAWLLANGSQPIEWQNINGT